MSSYIGIQKNKKINIKAKKYINFFLANIFKKI